MQNLKISKDIAQVLECYPKLVLNEEKKSKFLAGEIDIFDADGLYIDSYGVKINIPLNYPFGFPALYETSNKFPHIPDRHVNEGGSCCVCSLQEEDMIRQKGISIFDYIAGYVVPYLANQIHFDHTGLWANGDYEHGFDGIFQYYRELFKTTSIEETTDLLFILSKSRMNRNDLCFCGSNVKLKRCHLETYRTIKDFHPKRLFEDLAALKRLRKIVSKNN